MLNDEADAAGGEGMEMERLVLRFGGEGAKPIVDARLLVREAEATREISSARFDMLVLLAIEDARLLSKESEDMRESSSARVEIVLFAVGERQDWDWDSGWLSV